MRTDNEDVQVSYRRAGAPATCERDVPPLGVTAHPTAYGLLEHGHLLKMAERKSQTTSGYRLWRKVIRKYVYTFKTAVRPVSPDRIRRIVEWVCHVTVNVIGDRESAVADRSKTKDL